MLAPDPGLTNPAQPCGKDLSLADALDRLLHCGVSIQGNLTIGLADVDLLFMDLRLLLGSVDTIWPEGHPPVAANAPRLPSSSPSPEEEVVAIPSTRIEPSGAPRACVEYTQPVAPDLAAGAGGSSTAQGLVRLVLTLVKLLHDVLERQAIRRMEAGHLTEAQIDSIGAALFAQAEEISRLQRQFDFSDKDLSLDLAIPEGTL